MREPKSPKIPKKNPLVEHYYGPYTKRNFFISSFRTRTIIAPTTASSLEYSKTGSQQRYTLYYIV